ncbi:bifunctional 2-polyprenyl-6-hydroxyphenol methylase/3-demethylubiquinol 3-O-methyltransferase UbiG [Halomonas binhaiensis]|uniref:Ubiquinone biosynthesis O-methyltransferase n=1 Tax=Halomonas binhaiensis TaxID=2562282 RepID=A0A5C1NIF7_9GAMM|nr:bifunctional 2-polyprenyl-6-hydroxyphenol methylase/3-demethylubiquinol 3-O-methyltransferase UbiG [Halomonas binhaiensis]QEM81855.1 bifunctional 2-polyprenyl-6-hydroxyphenol methylase/3-demethylubiquinol 3-O-methyltransferase UbiG [Halomonas binhaiensis]
MTVSNTPTGNVDHNEISKFSAIADRWWDTQGEFKPLHDINPLRLDFIDNRAGLAGHQVLDVGCGGGILSESMARRGALVTGIDLSEAALEAGRRHADEQGVELDYRLISVEQLAEEAPESFDLVTCLEMLEHVPDPESVIRACTRLVKPGGHVVLSTINRNPKAYALMILAAEYALRMVPKGTHDYARFIRPSELARWCRDAGLKVNEQSGLVYQPLTRRFKLSPTDVSVNYLMHCRKEMQ